MSILNNYFQKYIIKQCLVIHHADSDMMNAIMHFETFIMTNWYTMIAVWKYPYNLSNKKPIEITEVELTAS